VNVKVRAGVCVVAYTRVIDRVRLVPRCRLGRSRAANCTPADSILLRRGTLSCARVCACRYAPILLRTLAMGTTSARERRHDRSRETWGYS